MGLMHSIDTICDCMFFPNWPIMIKECFKHIQTDSVGERYERTSIS